MARQGVVMSTTVDDLEFTQFWRNFKETGDLELRNELVLKYNWLVKSIVHRISSVRGSYTEAEDMTSYGIIGLIKAIEKFDIQRGVTFKTFATYRIRGEIINYMRRNDWEPMIVRKKILNVKVTTNNLINELGRQPTEEELSKKLGIGSSELKQTLSEMGRFSLDSFEEMIYDTVKIDYGIPDFETPDGHLQEKELLKMLAKALNDLPERERLIFKRYYYEELSFREISEIIGVSVSRISQIHSRAIKKMNKNLRLYTDV
jgi:RNA polymerase sigma factor for flagellar operon FliA